MLKLIKIIHSNKCSCINNKRNKYNRQIKFSLFSSLLSREVFVAYPKEERPYMTASLWMGFVHRGPFPCTKCHLRRIPYTNGCLPVRNAMFGVSRTPETLSLYKTLW